MSDIIKNGVHYGGTQNMVGVSALSARAIEDEDGNNLFETYMKQKDLDEVLKLQKFSAKNAGAHNSIFMGRDITERFNSGDVYAKIQDGSFENLFIGDYFIKEIYGKSMKCRIAGFNIYKDTNYAKPVYPNHIVIVPDEYFMTSKMNETNTTEGAYKGSMLYKTQIPIINEALKTAFTQDHLLVLKEQLTTHVDPNAPSGGYRGWNTCSDSSEITDSIADLMTEVEVYGTRVWSSSGLDIASGKVQMPLFALAPEYINPGRFSWWLRGVSYASGFPSVDGLGGAHACGASNAWLDVRITKRNYINPYNK